MNRFVLILLFVLAVLPVRGRQTFNVHDYGAKGDGVSIDTKAINAAIAEASKAHGGMVVFPAGTYLSYSIHLESNIILRLDEGAAIKAAPFTEMRGYDAPEPNESDYQDFGHSHWHNSLMWGENLHHITIEGKGLIDGTGVLLRGGMRQKWPGITEANKALALKNCRDVTVKGISFLNCGHFALLFTGVNDVLIEDVKADTNRDAFDIDCCEHVVIRGCKVNTPNDDAIVLKCSYALGYAKPTENVLIEHCEVSGYDVGSMLAGTCTTLQQTAPDGDGPTGRIKLGTESTGGFRNIKIRDCTFTHCRGLALETVDGAEMCDIDVRRIIMNDICNSPIYIRLGDRMRAPAGQQASSAHNIRIRDVKVKNADSRYACLIVGCENNPVSNVKMQNVDIEFRGGLTLDDVHEQRGSNPFFVHPKEEPHKGVGKCYPEPSAHGIQPAWGFAIYHADGVKLKDIRLSLMQKDERKMMNTENVKHLKIKRMSETCSINNIMKAIKH